MNASHNTAPRLPPLVSGPSESKFPSNLYWLLLLTMAFWIFLHPYKGIWHDSALYTVQALNILHPDIYSGDIFFLYGSQANYTLFPYLHAFLIKLMGIVQSALFLTITGQLLLLGSAIYLARRFLTPTFSLLFLILFATQHGYQNVVLSPFELFATSRSFSAGFSLLFLAFTMEKKWLAAIFSIACSVLIHPLIALGALVVFIFLQRPKVFLIVSLSAIFLAGIASLSGIEPFIRLNQTIDPEWLSLINQRASFLFLENWPSEDWNLIALEFSIVLSASACGNKKLRIFLYATAASTLLLLAISVIGGSYLSNVLLVQLQPWRILWLFHVAASIALASLIGYGLKTNYGKLVIVLYTSSFLLINYIGAISSFLIYLYWIWAIKHKPDLHRLWYIGAVVIFFQSVIWYLLSTYNAAIVSYAQADSVLWETVLLTLQKRHLFITAALIAALFLIKSNSSLYKLKIFQVITLLALATSSSYFDQRGQREPWDVGDKQVISFLRSHIPENATVYWENNLRATWFLLNRKSYISRQQTAGIVFSRDTAIEASLRSDRIEKFGFTDSGFYTVTSNDTPIYEDADIDYLCTDPGLDLMIISHPANKPPDKTIFIHSIRYGIYYCDN